LKNEKIFTIQRFELNYFMTYLTTAFSMFLFFAGGKNAERKEQTRSD
jgi:hypothetical protein